MRSPLLPLQKAIYDRLTQRISYPIYDEVSQDSEYPYIVLVSETMTDWSVKDTAGGEVTITLSLYSQGRGYKELKEMIDAVVQVITAENFSVAGFQVSESILELIEIMRADEITRQGILRFRFQIMEV